jgi:DNA-binding transcriptional regulator/RsmH inhibitor MraZ
MSAVVDWIDGGGRIVVGGKLTDELNRTKFSGLLAELGRRGSLRTYKKEEIDAELTKVATLPLKSNDPHVVALARLSGAMVAITNDNKLIADLKNQAICPGKRRAIRHRPGKPEMSANSVRALLAQAQCK